MNSQSKADVKDAPNPDSKDRPTGMPDVSQNDGTTSRQSESVVDDEPGPFDDDGLPENARRRVPS